jgi:DNA-binding NarL/FixJ family response regulator
MSTLEHANAGPAGAAGPLRLLTVDDHQMVLDGLRAMLEVYDERVQIIAEADSAEAAMSRIAEHDPDVVLLDVRLRSSSGLDLCRDILARWPDRNVVFLTVYDDEQYLYQALRLGARGFLLKRIQGAELVENLERVREGEVVVDATLAGRVALSAARLHSGEAWPGVHLGLTQRESEVLAFMVAGMSNKAIAQRLVVSAETIKSHCRGIYRKLDVPDRAGAVAVALREGVFR